MNKFSSNKDKVRTKYINLLNNELDNIKLSKKIEKELYNSCIRLSKLRYIVRRWENKVFKQLYISKLRSFYCNISDKSYIKNTQDIKIRKTYHEMIGIINTQSANIKSISNIYEYMDRLSVLKVGMTVPVLIERDGAEILFEVIF